MAGSILSLPRDQLITITVGELLDIINQVVAEATLDLKDEVAQLRASIDQQNEKIAAMEATQDTQGENEVNLLRIINDLREKQPEPTKKVKDHVEELYKLMAEEKNHWFSIAEIAFALKISKETARNLKAAILEDDRFEMGCAKSSLGMRGNKGVVIKIKQFIK